MLMANWRLIGSPSDFFVMAHPSGNYLVVYTRAAFDNLLAELRARTADKTELADIERGLNDKVRCSKLDRFGRLPLPPDLIAKTGIARQAELVGRFSRFEIWPCDKYEATQNERDQATASALRNLESL